MIHKISEFYKICHESIKVFPKQERYSLGQKIENTILEILEFALQATYLPKYRKTDFIRKASDRTDLLKYLVRLAYETKSINLKRYVIIEGKILEIGKMLGGWIKSTNSNLY